MRLPVLLLFMLPFYAGMAQTSSSKPNSTGKTSNIDVKGNSNIIRVIQGNTVTVYDLKDEKQFKQFLSYLERLPGIQQDVKKIVQQNKQILERLTNEQVFNTQTFIQSIDAYARENERLRIENEQLKKQVTDPEFAKALEEAAARLKVYDNAGYQQTLENFKIRKKKKISQARREYAEAAYLQAKDSYINFNFEKASEQIDETLSYDTSNVNYVILKALTESQLYHLDNSLAFYHKALTYTINDSLRAETYKKIGQTYSDKAIFGKALEFCGKALAIQEKLFGLADPITADTYYALGIVYNQSGNYDKALELHYKNLAILKKVLGENHPDLANTYRSIGSAYYQKRDYDKALYFHQKALDIKEKVYGREHPAAADSYNHLGLTYHSKGEFDKALAYYETYVIIQKTIFGNEHPNIASAYNNIGMLHSDKGDFDKALECCNKALTIHEKTDGAQHPNTSVTYNNIASIYHEKREYDKALVYYFKGLAIQEAVYGKQHEKTATTYNNIGSTYAEKGDDANSIEYYSKALAIIEKLFGKDHPRTGICYNNIALAYEHKKDHDKAIAYYIKDLEIEEKHYGKEHINTQYLIFNIATAYVLKEQKEKALYYLNKYTGTTYQKIKQLNTYAVNYYKEAKYAESIRLHLFSLDLLKTDPSLATDKTWAIVYKTLALTYCANNNKQDALLYFEKAMNFAKTIKAEPVFMDWLQVGYDECVSR